MNHIMVLVVQFVRTFMMLVDSSNNLKVFDELGMRLKNQPSYNIMAFIIFHWLSSSFAY